MNKTKKTMGRPPKFQGPRHPITVTLPERTLEALDDIHPDRAQAIVKAVDAVKMSKEEQPNAVETIEVCRGQGLIVVGPSRSLKKIPWLRLVEIAPLRYLLSIPSGTAVEALELAIRELIEELPPGEEYEVRLLRGIGEQISTVRKGRRLSKAEILFVATE